MSSFTWLDYDERDRRRMLDIISMFSERDTCDELGIGSVRDAFADMLFPGTSTIQTRARYFLFIPWMYRHLQGSRVPSAQVGNVGRQQELRLIPVLECGGDTAGIIGRVARNGLQRLPSNIYWLGLKRWGICRFNGSQDQYHRSLDSFYQHTERDRHYTDDGRGDLIVTRCRNWDPALPNPSADFPQHASLQLETQEACYLRDCIQYTAEGSLLAFLVTYCQPTERIDSPWNHPHYARFPKHIRDQLFHARNFAEIIHGAALLYNLMLAEERNAKIWVNDYTIRLNEWIKDIQVRLSDFHEWNIPQFWAIVRGEGAHVPVQTVRFVEQWIDLACNSSRLPLLRTEAAPRELIRRRERFLKGQLARLSNRRALEQWQGAAGAEMLHYRWRTAWQIVTDIQEGLMRGGVCA